MRICCFLFLSFISLFVFSQDKSQSPKIMIPNIPGFITLKGDFHMHTAYSDGHVWPTYRVMEAARDGLDVISITEHTDFEKFAGDIKRSRNRAYEIAAEQAKSSKILVIKGAEISPRVAPYHNNALFLEDLDAIPYPYMKSASGKFEMNEKISRADVMAPFLEVEKQGGFVFYNHPSYDWWVKGEDKDLFTDVHSELLKKGILGGVEVVNGQKYNQFAHRMADKYNLTLFANSDAHNEIAEQPAGFFRSMTLVFAKEQTVEAVEEAIRNRRTALFFKHYLVGRKAEVEALFHAAVKVKITLITDKKSPRLQAKLNNESDIPFNLKINSKYDIENAPMGLITIPARASVTIMINPIWDNPDSIDLNLEVTNILISPDENLKTKIVLNTKPK